MSELIPWHNPTRFPGLSSPPHQMVETAEPEEWMKKQSVDLIGCS